ncbi:adenosylcobinamide-GDP ribazoletransferase [Nocardioides sp.]|uniref:adenosylcobinamide-GDP ribazoletransferase n=1 Tax=Nocardioides sp. TaxID=35761 RepID=UPI002C01E995|nr:adenosylcobinamide-GDP ribazoletransferase [Nocardioides sp.]HXH79450.1 adenosylcobinamide-GDP ribazoletransferase [Nocardioides sp.]
MLLDAARLAVGTLTAIPVRPPATVDRRRAGVAMLLAPVAVLPLGLVVTGVGMAGHWLAVPPVITALVALGGAILGTRALHLDGLSDTVDGLAASYDRERSLTVMKSGTSGPAGVVAVVLVIGLQTAGLAAVFSLPDWWQAAILAGVAVCCSRAALAVCCVRGLQPARSDGLGRTYTQTVPRPVAVIVWILAGLALAAGAAGAGMPWWQGVLAAAVALVTIVAVLVRATRRFGGVTGDVFGAAIEMALAAILVALSLGSV